jgi:hypothetical protein
VLFTCVETTHAARADNTCVTDAVMGVRGRTVSSRKQYFRGYQDARPIAARLNAEGVPSPERHGCSGGGGVAVADAASSSERSDSILARVSSRVRSSSANLACSRASSSRILSDERFMVQTVFSHRKALAASHSELRI